MYSQIPVVPLLLGLASLGAQNPFTISDNVNLVLLDVSVTNSRGEFIRDLTKDNFRVSEDGRPRSITQFDSVDRPVTVGLVVDNSGSMRTKRPEVILAGLAFAKESNSQDEFFVTNFNDFVVPGLPKTLPFTDKIQTLRAALYYGEPRGQTALYDALAYSLKHLELGHRDKRTLIVVSDGGDNVSKTSLPDLTTLVIASRTTIYTVGLLDPENRDLNPGVLRKLAVISGGQYFQPRQLEDVVPIFKKISNEIRSRYTIGFVPSEEDKRTARSVKVIAAQEKRKFIVRTRTTYSVGPQAAKQN